MDSYASTESVNQQPSGAQTYRYLFTVFTPTYNRAHTLGRVYTSLMNQTCRDFEWLIVDDGSIDDTKALVDSWRQQASFPIRYLYQENSGKHVAYNRAVPKAHGQLFLTLNSDDACTPQALERFKHHWENIPEPQRPRFSAVTALCMDQHGSVVGDRFPSDILDSNSLELTYKLKIKGEKWGFQRTDVLQRYPFPVIKAKYIPENIVWHAIARSYQTRFVNEALRIYYVSETDRSDQLMQAAHVRPIAAAASGVVWHRSQLCDDIAWFRHAPGEFARAAILYSRFAFHTGTPLHRQLAALTNPLAILLVAGAWPFGYALHLRDKRRLAAHRARFP